MKDKPALGTPDHPTFGYMTKDGPVIFDNREDIEYALKRAMKIKNRMIEIAKSLLLVDQFTQLRMVIAQLVETTDEINSLESLLRMLDTLGPILDNPPQAGGDRVMVHRPGLSPMDELDSVMFHDLVDITDREVLKLLGLVH